MAILESKACTTSRRVDFRGNSVTGMFACHRRNSERSIHEPIFCRSCNPIFLHGRVLVKFDHSIFSSGFFFFPTFSVVSQSDISACHLIRRVAAQKQFRLRAFIVFLQYRSLAASAETRYSSTGTSSHHDLRFLLSLLLKTVAQHSSCLRCEE